jgi:hypothetical protein
MSKTLKVLTSIYAVLYVALIVSAIFDEGFRKQGAATLAVFIPLVIFLVGYVVIWKNEIYGGLIFVLWYLGMWYVGYVLSETDRGVAPVIGFPLFVLAVLHIISGYRNRKVGQETVQKD